MSRPIGVIARYTEGRGHMRLRERLSARPSGLEEWVSELAEWVCPREMGFDPDASLSVSTELRAGPTTPAEARLFLSKALETFDVDVDRDAARLLTSELASNAARHGKEPIDVSISVEHEGLRVSVLDHGSGFDPGELSFGEALSAGDWAEDGRGLRLVDALSTDWGVERGDDGTEVWFRL